MNLQIIKTDSKNTDFINLVKLLDADLAIRDGDDHAFYDQFNKLDTINEVIVIIENQKAIGCGAFKEFSFQKAEIKRMFVLPNYRSKGFASKILNELESWAKELGFKKCILETGFKQPEAIRLYEKNNYLKIENYGQYKGIETSYCFEKSII